MANKQLRKIWNSNTSNHISVAGSLPKIKRNHWETEPLITRNKKGEINLHTFSYVSTNFVEKMFWLSCDLKTKVDDVTHWMPLPDAPAK